MKNKSTVKLEYANPDWFITIGDNDVEHTWAVSSEELAELRRKLNNINFDEN